MTEEILMLKIATGVFLTVIGIPNRIIDYKHRKNKAYEPGNEFSYYNQLAKEGSWEGKFMVASGFLAMYFILGVLLYGFYVLARK